MIKTWRWFGPRDRITLGELRQIGVEGIVTSLHDVPAGAEWTREAVRGMVQTIENHGLVWSVVESLPVSEAIKYGGAERDELIARYIRSLDALGEAGVRTVCYNFMPVIDWIRTDLAHKWDDGTTSLYFDSVRFAYFDTRILGRRGEYSDEILRRVEELSRVITERERDELIDAIIVKTQGFVHGNISENDLDPVAKFKRLLALYDGVGRDELRENMRYFLAQVMPVCEKWGIGMCVHPDDPPRAVLGLPRIVSSADDIEWILRAVDNPCNGLTFCAGSLSAGEQNDVVEMAQRFAPRVKFAHLRSTEILPNGDFIETSHLSGRGRLIELMRIFERENPRLPFRVDHGRAMLDDAQKGYNAGYPLIGRMFALAQMDGVMAVVRDEIERKYV